MFLLVVEGLSRLVTKATDQGIFEATELGRDKVKVSHLQYADDMIFMGKANAHNALVMKQILKNFELLFELKVNFNKNSIMGLNISSRRMEEMMNILGCEVGSFLF